MAVMTCTFSFGLRASVISFCTVYSFSLNFMDLKPLSLLYPKTT